MAARYILRLDDVAPNMDASRYLALKEVLLETGVRPLLGVIPDNRDPSLLAYPACPFDFWAEMRDVQDRGWKIAQHGYRHQYTTPSGGLLGLADQSEFAGLPQREQRDKLAQGREILAHHGLESDTFMAPGHSFDEATLAALGELGFRKITDGFALFPYRSQGLLFVPQLTEAPRALPLGVLTFCQHLNTIRDARFETLLAFLRQHRERFISFDDAELHVSRIGLDRPLARWARRLASLRRASLRRAGARRA